MADTREREIHTSPVSQGTRQCVVLDTSALVSDPSAIYAFPKTDVVIPLTVIEELDGLKTRPGEVGYLAREALRTLETLRVQAGGNLHDQHMLENGSTVRVEINGVQRHLLIEHGLDPDKADNRIIGAALGQAQHCDVVVVSNDAAFRLKAAHLGLVADEHRSDKIQPTGPGWAVREVHHSIINDLYADGSADVAEIAQEDAAGPEPAENTFVVLRAGSQSALGRVRDDRVRLLSPRSEHAWGLRPRSKEQKFAMDLLMDPDIAVVALDGPAGTGKSLLAIAAGLEQVVEQGLYHRISVFRSLVPVGREDLGFLPGDLAAKTTPYFAAVYDAITALTESRNPKAAERLVEEMTGRGQLTLEPVTFLRGRSLSGTYIIVDEATNLERGILKTLLTRVSQGTKIVFTGDVSQIDNAFASASNNALTALIESFSGQQCFGHVTLTACERSQVASLAAELL